MSPENYGATMVNPEATARLEKIQKARVERSWKSIHDELSRATLTMNGFDASKAIGEVNLFDLKNKLLRLINACQSEIDIGETDKTNRILPDYTRAAEMISELKISLEQLMKTLKPENLKNNFETVAELKAQYDVQKSKFNEVSSLVKRMIEGELVTA